MTTLPTPGVKLATDAAAGIHALLELAQAGHLELDPDLVAEVHTAAALTAAGTEHGARHRELQAVSPERGAQDRAIEAAAAGGDILEASRFVWQHQAATAQAEAEYRVIASAAREASNLLAVRVSRETPRYGAELLEVLDSVLADALEPAQVMAGAERFDYSDPAAVHAAPEPVRRAFGALVELAEPHDRIRRCAVGLWTGSAGQLRPIREEWAGVEAFAGAGVEHYLPHTGGDTRWRYSPAGHPVQRIAAAAIAAAEGFEEAT